MEVRAAGGQRRGFTSSGSGGGVSYGTGVLVIPRPLGCMFEGRHGEGQGALGREAGGQQAEGLGKVGPQGTGATPLGAQSTPPDSPAVSRGSSEASSGISEFTWDQTPHNNLNDQWARFFNFRQEFILV